MSDDLQLFQKISAGDEKAFATIFHRYTPLLFPFIKKLSRNEQVATELVQETFMQLWLHRAQLKDIENPSAWIYRIASNISINYLKKTANRKFLLSKVNIQEVTSNPVEQLETKEFTQIIQNAIAQLPDRRKEVYRLSRDEGLTHQQIAEKLNISTNTVKNQIGTALKFIQEFINKQKNLPIILIFFFLLLKFFLRLHSPFRFFN